MKRRKQSGFSLAVCSMAALVMCGLAGCAAKAEPISKTDFMLNTFVTVTLYDSQDTEILEESMELCRSYENVFSKTLDTSELWRINHRNKNDLAVSEDMAELLNIGLHYSRLSDGDFDITVEPLSSLWDFTAENPVIPAEEEIKAALAKVGYQNLKTEGNRAVFLTSDTTVDLGGIAKGYIADQMKEYLLGHGVKSAVINLGGNVLCVGEKPDGSPFKIGLQKPFEDRNETIASINIRDMSVVSSGVYERHFIVDGVNYHHILDPRSGYPYENGLISVTIISPKSIDGDGLSTACFSMGLDKGMRLIDSIDGTYAVFITKDYELHYSQGAKQFLVEE